VGQIDSWKHPFAKYKLVAERVTDESTWKMFFSAVDFNILKKLSKKEETDPSGPIAIVYEVKTTTDREKLKQMLLAKSDPLVHWFAGSIAGLAEAGAGIAYGIWQLIIENSPLVKDQERLSVLISTGGKIFYEERITQDGKWWLTRSIFYQAQVDNETRRVPLWISKLPAEIE
jgi:hypothetical protein